jgi:hypothetical protein
MKNLSRCAATLFALSLTALSTGPASAVIRPMWGGGGHGTVNASGMYSGSISDSVLGTGTAVANLAQFAGFTGSGSGSGSGDVRALDCGGGGDVRALDCGGGGGGASIGGYLNSTFGTTVYSSPVSASINTGGCGGSGDVRALDCGGGGNGQWLGGPLKHHRGGVDPFGIFVTIIGSAACTFGFHATYDPSSFVLSGTYQAIVGCSGESGTFSLTQQCYYPERNLRRNTGSGLGACT